MTHVPPVPSLVTSKLVPPFARPGIVERADLLDRIAGEATAPVLAVVAPAGYGKSTLLQQWAAAVPRPMSWLTLDEDDDDPVLLLTYLAAALDRIVPIDPEVFALLAVEHPTVSAITRSLGAAFAAAPRPCALVVDDVHRLGNPASHDVLASLVEHTPAASYVALASRRQLPLPVARLRAQGRLVEVGPEDLTMDADEARTLVRGVGVDLATAQLRELVEVAEGWPVALYLAARSLRTRGETTSAQVADLSHISHVGQSRDIVAYAHAELLSSLPAATVRFLTRSAVLDRMSGPLCDAVLRTYDSAERLEELTRSSLLVVPLDDHRSWYRYHHIFRDLLRAELELREPELVPELLGRAGQWCQANGLADDGIEYAMAADDADRAARLVTERALVLYRTGRTATLERWFDWFDDGGHMSRQPAVATAGAFTAAVIGRAAAAERWADAAERGLVSHPPDTGAVVLEARLAMMRAALCRAGVDRALDDARHAVDLLPTDDPWRTTALVVLGVVLRATGALEDADAAFQDALEVGRDTGALPGASVAVAQRALIASARGDDSAAQSLASQARGLVETGRLQDHVTNVFVYAVAARMAGRRGDVAQAKTYATMAQRLRPHLGHALPHLAVQARLELVRTMLSVADGPGARTLLREIADILRLRPHLGVLVAEAEDLRAQVQLTPGTTIGASSLTTAELRLLPLLQTYLTFREIGERLFVSPHTVKTQAISIYRKLGVSSRSDAMEQATKVGLLPS